MPPLVTPGLLYLSAILFVLFLAMTASWAWALYRLANHKPLLPPLRPVEVPWGTLSVLAVFATYLVVNVLVVEVYARVSHHPAKDPLAFHEKMLITGIMYGALIVVIPLVLRRTSGARLKHLGLSWCRIDRQVATGALAFLIVTLPVNLMNLLSVQVWKRHPHELELMMRDPAGAGMPLGQLAALAVVTAVFCAPIGEELIFRGVIQNWLERMWQRLRNPRPPAPAEFIRFEELVVIDPKAPVESPQPHFWTDNPYEAPQALPTAVPDRPEEPELTERPAGLMPVVVTSLLFAALHAPQWPAPIAIFFLSLALGVVYQRTRSLIASFVLHALFNGLSTLILLMTLFSGNLPANAKKAVPPEAHAVQAPAPNSFVQEIRH